MRSEPGVDSKNPLGCKINRIIEFTGHADESFFESLGVLSKSYTSNNPRSIRNLRCIIEKSRLNLANEFLQQMSAIKTGLDSLSGELNTMSNSCSRIKERLMHAKSRMEELLNQTNITQVQKNSISLTHLAANAILSEFYISEDDWSLLKIQLDSSNSDSLLTKLERAKSIRHRIISAIGAPNLPLTKDLLDSSTMYIDKAFELLYQWIKVQIRNKNLEAVEINAPFRRCINVLQERPIFFKYVLDEYASTRRQLIVSAFLHALTVGVNDGESVALTALSNPIEMQSHDPTRYAGDMLAYIHQAAASEKEYIASFTSEISDKGLICDCLNNMTSGLAHPLQLRLEQILVTEHSALLLYKINNLLQFYANVILNLLDEKAILFTTLSTLQALSWNLFINALKCQISEMLAESESPRDDLMPSISIGDVARLLEAVLTTPDMSCTPPDVRQTRCEEIAAVVVRPLLEYHESVARAFASSQKMPKAEAEGTVELPPEALVYFLNSLHSLHSALARIPFTGAQIAAVVERLEIVLMCLTRAQTAHIFTRAGISHLSEVLNAPHGMKDAVAGPLAQIGEPGCSQAEIIEALRRFNIEYLLNPDAWELPEVTHIAFPRPRNALRRRTADLVHSLYALLYETITNDKSDSSIPWPENLKTPEQVASLLIPSPSPAPAIS